MALFEKAAQEKDIKVFINIGGSWSNMGLDSMVLHLKPGLNRIEKFPPPERRGVIYAMAARGIPVIHLLYVRGLARRYALPWDPYPLPRPGEGGIYRRTRSNNRFFFLSALVYLAVLSAVMVRLRLASRPPAG